jgi:tetratricopeptide (TPR) repeat protein
MAIPMTTQCHPAVRRAAAAALVAALAAALGLAACRGTPKSPARSDALRGEALGPVVDSVVVPPFERGPGVQINPLDLNLFREQLEAQLTAGGERKAYPAPPSTLANTVTLSGTLLGYEVREQTGDGMFLRSIDMAVRVAVRIGGEKEPALTLSRDYSYQKLYRTTQGVAALEFDLHNAAREATGAIARALVPGKPEAPRLEAATDAGSGENYSHPWLVRGNREAGFARYDRAISAWSLLLFNPAVEPEELYRVSDRTLARLRLAGASEQELTALKPLTRRDGEELEDLRERVAKALGPKSTLEPKVLQLSDEDADRIQLNLARAHYNLSSVYQRFARYDLVAFHLSRAYGYDPKADYLNAWVRLQAQRNLVPGDVQGRPAEALAWIQAYQRVPAPFTATVSGGSYDKNVMPALAFQPAPSPVPLPTPAVPNLNAVPLPNSAGPASGQVRPGAQGTPVQRPRVYGQPAPPAPPTKSAQRLGY